MDSRSKAMDYDPERDFDINTDATRRFPLVANATLSKFGFDPVKLAVLIANYRSLQQSLMGERNPHEYLFFEIKRGASVVPVSAEGLSTRMARVTERLFGQTLGATMFRSMFVSCAHSTGGVYQRHNCTAQAPAVVAAGLRQAPPCHGQEHEDLR
jgi:hypothetical protein